MADEETIEAEEPTGDETQQTDEGSGGGGSDELIDIEGDGDGEGGAAEEDLIDIGSTDGDEETTEGQTEEGEGGEETPDTYAEFEVPEGIQIHESDMEAATSFFKEQGWDQPTAQKAISLFSEIQLQIAARNQEQLGQMKTEWQEELSQDKKLGGENLNASRNLIRSLLKAAEDKGKVGAAFAGKLKEFGIASNPALFRFLHWVGKTIGEDRLNPDPPSGGAQSDEGWRGFYAKDHDSSGD